MPPEKADARTRPVDLLEHDPRWLWLANAELRDLRRALASSIAGAEHFGSTAVPGLVAKPTIDLMLATQLWPWPAELDMQLRELGFHFYKAPNPKWRVYLKERDGRQRGFHLHIVEAESQHWHEHLLFRDHLRRHTEDAQTYGRLKVALAQAYPEQLGQYQVGKADLVREIMQRAQKSE